MPNLCMNCMQPMEELGAGIAPVCPHCGWDNSTKQPAYALPYNTLLQGRYAVGRVLSVNGEGCTYVALDRESRSLAKIREFYPQSIAGRGEDRVSVWAQPEHNALYAEYMAEFQDSARRVARLRELAPIVSVYDIFEENHTAYCVEEWTNSISLRQYIERSGGKVDWTTARQLFMPLLTALSSMSSAGVHHLAVSPETIRVLPDGKIHLGDFCCESVRRKGTALKPDLHSGCAALEQYTGDMKCGESTDVYGFAASLLFALTGVLPKNALLRKKDARLLISSQVLKPIPPHVVSALASALQVMPGERTATFERLRAELSAAPTVTASIETREIRKRLPATYQDIPEDKGLPPVFWMVGSCIITLVVILIAVLMMRNCGCGGAFGLDPAVSSSEPASSVVSVSQPESSEVSDEASSDSGIVIQVPALYNEDYEEWMAKTEDGTLNFSIRLSEQQYHDTVPEGAIISQSPEAGAEIGAGSTVTVIVSRGPRMRALPYVANLKLAEASEALSEAGFNAVKEDVYSDTVPYGYIVDYKYYSAGDECEADTDVVILLSKGPDRNNSGLGEP